MWEAVAAPGRGGDLLAWVAAHAAGDARVFGSRDGRVVVVARAPLELPDPPAEMLGRPPHRWDFAEYARR